MSTTVTFSLDSDQLVRLAARAASQGAAARCALSRGNSHEAIAHFYRIDTEIVSRLFMALPDDIQEAIKAQADYFTEVAVEAAKKCACCDHGDTGGSFKSNNGGGLKFNDDELPPFSPPGK